MTHFRFGFIVAASVGFALVQPALADQHIAPIGSIVEISPTGSDGVQLLHPGQRPTTMSAYQPVYVGDMIEVTKPDVKAVLEMSTLDGGSITLDMASRRYTATSRLSVVTISSWLEKYVLGIVKSRGIRASGATYAKGPTQSDGISKSPWVTAAAQIVRAGQAQTFVVAWSGKSVDGSPVMVSLTDATGAVVSTTTVPPAKDAVAPKVDSNAAESGFVLLKCRKLRPGDYTLTIEDSKRPLRIRVTASSTVPSQRAGAGDRAVDAADRLRDGQDSDKLQALADLQTVSDKVYIAKAVIDAVREGRPPPR